MWKSVEGVVGSQLTVMTKVRVELQAINVLRGTAAALAVAGDALLVATDVVTLVVAGDCVDVVTVGWAGVEGEGEEGADLGQGLGAAVDKKVCQGWGGHEGDGAEDGGKLHGGCMEVDVLGMWSAVNFLFSGSGDWMLKADAGGLSWFSGWTQGGLYT